MIRQLVFDLPPVVALTRADFLISPANASALQAIDGWRDWPGAKLVLIGPEGSGKTHLARIWADGTADGTAVGTGEGTGGGAAAILSAADLARIDIAPLAGQRVVVEDAQATGPNEAALFHLHNLVTTSGGALLLTADKPPRDWGLSLPDLLSRMQAAALARLEAPDDALLASVLVKLFADRQVQVSPALVGFLVSRMPRSIGTARRLVAALDEAALAAGRPVTRSLAARVLDSLSLA